MPTASEAVEPAVVIMDYCYDCRRSFYNIQAHYANSSRHIYCQRCDRDFVSIIARQMHWENHSAHNLCDVCGFDGEDEDELEDHFRKEGCYTYLCYGCNTWFRDRSAFRAHQDAFVACHKCDKHCLNHNNLAQHLKTHEVAKLECWGCYRKFVHLSHMILHLESGTCPSECSLPDINFTLMAKCKNLLDFIDSDYINDFRRGIDIQQVYGRAFPFQCMECSETFRQFSGLCQHLENSVTCNLNTSDVSFRSLLRSLETQFDRKFL